MPTKARLAKSLRSQRQALVLSLLSDTRLKANITQQQLADRLGKPQSFVAKYEGGERRIDIVEFISIAEALEADPVKLLQKIARG